MALAPHAAPFQPPHPTPHPKTKRIWKLSSRYDSCNLFCEMSCQFCAHLNSWGYLLPNITSQAPPNFLKYTSRFSKIDPASNSPMIRIQFMMWWWNQMPPHLHPPIAHHLVGFVGYTIHIFAGRLGVSGAVSIVPSPKRVGNGGKLGA